MLILPAALGMLTIYVGDQEAIGDLRIARIEDLQPRIDLSDNYSLQSFK